MKLIITLLLSVYSITAISSTPVEKDRGVIKIHSLNPANKPLHNYIKYPYMCINEQTIYSEIEQSSSEDWVMCKIEDINDKYPKKDNCYIAYNCQSKNQEL